jgi:hypothetical protein
MGCEKNLTFTGSLFSPLHNFQDNGRRQLIIKVVNHFLFCKRKGSASRIEKQIFHLLLLGRRLPLPQGRITFFFVVG